MYAYCKLINYFFYIGLLFIVLQLMIDHRKRYQVGLTLNDVYPAKQGLCACGCGMKLSVRQRKWASSSCRNNAFNRFAVIKGDTQLIRQRLFIMDQGACRCCGEITENWQADHILSVCQGGGGMDIINFQTLCISCHKEKVIMCPTKVLFLRMQLRSC